MPTPEQTRSEDWKDKYFKALNELDDQERRRAEKIGRISRDLLGVLARFRGIGPVFDRDLDSLGAIDALHDDVHQARLHTLVGTLERLSAAGVARLTPASGHSALAPVRALLEQLVLPARLRTAFVEVERHLQLMADDDTLASIAAIAAQISAILSTPGEEPALAARDSLQNLIDQLSLPAAAQEQLAAITAQLQQAQGGGEVKAIAGDLADFVVDYVTTLHGEISGLNSFLLQVKSRLGDVSGYMANEKNERTVASAAREDLSASLRHSLTTMRGGVSIATSIEQVKVDIERQIAAIDLNVAAFLKADSTRSSQADAQHRVLTRQLAELEGESDKLRRKLAMAQNRAMQDTLTGLPNRLAYNERLQAEYSRWQRSGHALSLVVLDIDAFKSINDNWGHQAGDRVLKYLARELGSQVRAQDFLGRYGGEEFVLILPDTGRGGALALAEELRRHIESCRFKFKDVPVKVTISCGIAELGAAESIESAFARADAGLYAAKQRGRNRCEALDAA